MVGRREVWYYEKYKPNRICPVCNKKDTVKYCGMYVRLCQMICHYPKILMLLNVKSVGCVMQIQVQASMIMMFIMKNATYMLAEVQKVHLCMKK